jgi:hypothetical protein
VNRAAVSAADDLTAPLVGKSFGKNIEYNIWSSTTGWIRPPAIPPVTDIAGFLRRIYEKDKKSITNDDAESSHWFNLAD